MSDSVSIDCPSVSARPNDPDKRLWLIATGVAGGIATLATAVPFVSSFAPSERAKAAGGPVEVSVLARHRGWQKRDSTPRAIGVKG